MTCLMWFWTVESNVDPINWCVIRMLSPIVSVIKNHESLTLKVSNCAFFFHIYQDRIKTQLFKSYLLLSLFRSE